MRIGIDISQLVYDGTGVANYLRDWIKGLLMIDNRNDYILFFSSFRGKVPLSIIYDLSSYKNVQVKQFRFPPTVLDLLWNRLHILPIEQLIGDVDIFISSDWTQPPTKKAKKATILYDLIVYKHPQETAAVIVETQKRRLNWVKKECDAIFCISDATKNDAHEILGIPYDKLEVVYPGMQRV